MKLLFKKLQEDANLPTRGSEHAAGYDLHCTERVFLGPLKRVSVSTGISVAIPTGYYGRIAPRSGSAAKQGVDVMAGVIDPDYRGEIKVLLINASHPDSPHATFNPGDRIAQLIIEKIATPEPEWADELPDTVRGGNGFGSSGK